MRSWWIVSAMLALCLAFTAGAAAQERALYRTSFEAPSFKVGLFAGQMGTLAGQGWFAGANASAATIARERSRVGRQGLRISGAKIKPNFGYYAGSYARAFIYDPLARRTPILRLSASISMSGKAENSCGLGVGLSGVLMGEFFPNVVIGVREQEGRLAAYLSNANNVFVTGPDYVLGQWARVEVVYDFRARTATGFFNGERFGRVPLTKGMSRDVGAINIFLGSQRAIPRTVAFVDDLFLRTQ